MSTGFPSHRSFTRQREQFLAAATAAGARLYHYPHPLCGPFGEALGTDVALIGNPQAKHLLIALSGTHGVEGFYGSDCQSRWLQTFNPQTLPDDVAVLMIHLINPWGTAWIRRVNEDNIDLNRNFLDFSQAPPDNQAYEALHAIYTCDQLRGPHREQADARLNERVQGEGWPAVMSIVDCRLSRLASIAIPTDCFMAATVPVGRTGRCTKFCASTLPAPASPCASTCIPARVIMVIQCC